MNDVVIQNAKVLAVEDEMRIAGKVAVHLGQFDARGARQGGRVNLAATDHERRVRDAEAAPFRAREDKSAAHGLRRRLNFDLLGLPPSPEDVDRFVADKSPAAVETLVDRLLASPQYGERWGRHWLDVARYADTKGYVLFQDANFPW